MPSFDRIRSRRHDASVFLYAFDLIELSGDDLRRDPDLIAGILNRNGLKTGNGNRWTRGRVTLMRSHPGVQARRMRIWAMESRQSHPQSPRPLFGVSFLMRLNRRAESAEFRSACIEMVPFPCRGEGDHRSMAAHDNELRPSPGRPDLARRQACAARDHNKRMSSRPSTPRRRASLAELLCPLRRQTPNADECQRHVVASLMFHNFL
jgi:hypothetical protein